MLENLSFDFNLIVELIKFVIFSIISIILTIKTKNINYLEDFMKYKTEHSKKEENVGITFENLKPIYRLNKATNQLEKTDDYVDIQELVNSSKESCLQAVLDRFMPVEETNIQQSILTDMTDNLDKMRELANKAEEYKSLLKLDPSLSISDVFAQVSIQANKIKEVLDKKAVEQPVEKPVEQPVEMPVQVLPEKHYGDTTQLPVDLPISTNK